MKSLKTINNQPFQCSEIPFIQESKVFDTISECLLTGYRMIGLFPVDRANPHRLLYVFASPISSSLHIIGGECGKNHLEIESLANDFPHTGYFECELAESCGYTIRNHPDLRPVRKQKTINGNIPYQFYKLHGDEIHEVAVGPIHAGIIEPGHFRFQCHGETVYNLEINLGYQYRGMEELMLQTDKSQRIQIAESIAGDTVIGHTHAHCNALEGLSNSNISLRAQIIRSIAEELERIAMHISGLGGVANDIGLAIAASSYGRLRTLVINSLAEISGSRFGRGLFAYGGVQFDLNDKTIIRIKNNLDVVRNDITSINELFFNSIGALIRFEQTGFVSKEKARIHGLIGTSARASGLEIDSRTCYPYGAYRYLPVSLITLPTGDVFARTRLRAMEIEESFRFIYDQIGELPSGNVLDHFGSLSPDTGIISIVEGWRGEVVHAAITDNAGTIIQYKIKDPSFNNWFGLHVAMQNNAISDFPLCNKSFDLSYAGHDL